jgi:hypothetical protein
MFVFEMARYNLAAQQLKNCLDSAALAAACSTTGSNAASPGATQTIAMNAAMYMYQQNSILSFPLTSTPAPAGYGTTNPSWSPVTNQAQLYFEFLDPVTKLPVSYGSANGKILRVFGSWGFTPITAQFTGLNIGPYVIQDQSDGGLPQLDVVLCFDISSSMDDFTNISLVNRSDNGSSGIAYTLPGAVTPVTDPTTGIVYKQQGPLYYAINSNNPLGTSVNATCPMDLDNGANPSPTQGMYQFNVGGHGTQTSSPPPQTTTQTSTSNGGLSFTDLVVNLDGTATESTGITVNGFPFPADDATHKGLGVLVEAARGNLESTAIATAAHVPYTTWGITPKSGWFAAYWDAAMSAQSGYPTGAVTPLRHPIGDAILASENFFQILNNDADVHFGLVTFGSGVGSGPGSNLGSMSAIENGYNSGSWPSNPTPPNPLIPLVKAAGPTNSNYSTVIPPPTTSVNGAMFCVNTVAPPLTQITQTLVAEGGTNIQQSLDSALAMLLGSKTTDATTTPMGGPVQNLSRPGATRAIVLFTDGEPNYNTDVGTSDPQCQLEAKGAKNAGIPIYTIGLCLVPSLQANQTTVLTDASGSNGIAALSKNGATFTQTTSASGLTAVFQNVARQLVQLVQ